MTMPVSLRSIVTTNNAHTLHLRPATNPTLNLVGMLWFARPTSMRYAVFSPTPSRQKTVSANDNNSMCCFLFFCSVISDYHFFSPLIKIRGFGHIKPVPKVFNSKQFAGCNDAKPMVFLASSKADAVEKLDQFFVCHFKPPDTLSVLYSQ
jgi:hypothetical protein